MNSHRTRSNDKKLRLRRESIRVLDPARLGNVVGGLIARKPSEIAKQCTSHSDDDAATCA